MPKAASPCHNLPTTDGGGDASTLVSRDPGHLGNPRFFIQRATPHLFALGAIQKIAEEITESLQLQFASAKVGACASGGVVRKDLSEKGISFGFVVVSSDTK